MKRTLSKTEMFGILMGIMVSNIVTDEMRIASQPLWLRVLVGTVITGGIIWTVTFVASRKEKKD